MRTMLMSLSIIAGATLAAGAQAAPHAVPFAIAPAPAARVQPVQHYEDWRYREWRRHEAYERWRRHEARRAYDHRRGYGYY